MYRKNFDVIVVGGGHAGIEAALASARCGSSTLLLTDKFSTIGQLSCNPSIGGIGKTHIVKEIDSLGGVMAYSADYAGIQSRVLNSAKGKAVQANRVQVDRSLYKFCVQRVVSRQKNLLVLEDTVVSLVMKDDIVSGVITLNGMRILSESVIVTTGTFLNGKIHIGDKTYSAGRAGDNSSVSLARFLLNLPFRSGTLKTGTPPRLDARTINYSMLEKQVAENLFQNLSCINSHHCYPLQVPCYITNTNKLTHDIISRGLETSIMYSGDNSSVGPRYCPSIEDKVIRFPEKLSHQIFLEPEGIYSNEVYPSGLSTSLDYSVQKEFIRSIRGLERSRILRPGYAVEYSFFDPRGIKKTMETKSIKRLFFAGQINGTTGYEEAAAQGLIAGINACLLSKNLKGWAPRRDESYIGVMIDDLVTQGVQEPYRMFTSRSEYRLSLRQDNADIRMTEKGYLLGCVSRQRLLSLRKKYENVTEEKLRIIKTGKLPKDYFSALFSPSTGENNRFSEVTTNFEHKSNIYLTNNTSRCKKEELEQVETQIKYKGYLERQKKEILRRQDDETIEIPVNINYKTISGLSNEAYEKLTAIQPCNIGQASRIPGITPAAIYLLLVQIKKHLRDNSKKNT